MKRFVYFLMVGLAFTVFQVAPVGADDSMLPGATGEPPMGEQHPNAAGCPQGDCGDQGHPPGEHHDPTMPPPGDHGGIPMCGDVPCPPPEGDGHHDGPPPAQDCGGVPCPTEHHEGEHPPGEHHDPTMPPPGEHGENHSMGDPGCDPNLAPDVAGGCADGFQGNPGGPPGEHHDGPDCASLPTPGEVAACEAGPPPGEHHDPANAGGAGHHDGPDCSEIPSPDGRALCELTKAEGRPPTEAECQALSDPQGQAECMGHTAGMSQQFDQENPNSNMDANNPQPGMNQQFDQENPNSNMDANNPQPGMN